MLNQAYMHKKGPPKMVKDLKFGTNAHLRQSLLDITEIQNLNKIFVGRKTHYRIQNLKSDPNFKHKENPTSEQTQLDFKKEEFVLSPEENLELIKKQRITNKMKDKLNQMFRQQEIRKYKLRKPVIHNMLEEFKDSFRVQEHPKYRQALKNSEKQLEHIKINSKKRVSSQYTRTDTSNSRAKFLSITTSKPTINKNYFPTFGDFVKGKYNVEEKPIVTIDISKIDNYFETMITEPILQGHPSFQKKPSSSDYIRQMNRQSHSATPVLGATRVVNRSPSVAMPTESEQTASWSDCSRCVQQIKNKPHAKPSIVELQKNFQNAKNVRNIRSKSAVNPNLSFYRSQQSSKKIISAMQTYYSVKKQKNQECDTIVEYMRKDRPLTSHLRRKNYKVIGHQSIQNVDKYRQRSQEERVKLLERNYNFYISLLKIFEHCNEDEIGTSLQILERLKLFFESEYILFVDDVSAICQLTKGEKEDFGVRIIRENLMEYAKKDPNFTTENDEDYEIL